MIVVFVVGFVLGAASYHRALHRIETRLARAQADHTWRDYAP